MTIGKNIAKLRKDNGMTQEQLAEMLGTSPQSVSKWETGSTMPDIMLLPVIAGCLNTTLDELYGCGKPKENRRSIDYNEIPEILYDTLIELTQRARMGLGEEKNIEEEKEKMKAYLAQNSQVKTATFSSHSGAVIATSEIGLLHRGVANAHQLTGSGIGRVLEILSDAAVRRVLAYETEHMTENLTPSYAAKKCALSTEEAANALEMLKEIRVNDVQEVLLDEDNPTRIYSLGEGEWVMLALMILKTARLIEENQQHYFTYFGPCNQLWLQ